MNSMCQFRIAALLRFIGPRFAGIPYVHLTDISDSVLEYRDGFTIKSNDIIKFSNCVTSEILVRNG